KPAGSSHREIPTSTAPDEIRLRARVSIQPRQFLPGLFYFRRLTGAIPGDSINLPVQHFPPGDSRHAILLPRPPLCNGKLDGYAFRFAVGVRRSHGGYARGRARKDAQGTSVPAGNLP